MSWQVDTPRQCCRGDHHLDMSVSKQILSQSPVKSAHAGMMYGKAIGKQIFQFKILENEKNNEHMFIHGTISDDGHWSG